MILPEAAEYMEADEMPFFEVGDLSSFLYMKPPQISQTLFGVMEKS
jgi:hypothetical protein